MTNPIQPIQGPEHPARVLAHVQFMTWAPSKGGQINTTQVMAASISVWVNHPEDMRYPSSERGAEHALAIAKGLLEKQRIEVLSFLMVQVTQQLESTILNQPAQVDPELVSGPRLVHDN